MEEINSISMEKIEKSALYANPEKKELTKSFGLKDEFISTMVKFEYQWNIGSYPNELINLLHNFVDTGRIYILFDEKINVSLNSFVSSIIHILESETDRDTLKIRIKKADRILQGTFIPFFTDFCKEYKAGPILFPIIIKIALTSIVKENTKDKEKDFAKALETEVTKSINNILNLVIKKSRVSIKENTIKFINNTLTMIPVLAQLPSEINEKKLSELLSSSGLTLSLFIKIQNLIYDNLMATIEKNLRQTVMLQKIKTKEDLSNFITLPVSKKGAEKIIKSLKQIGTKTLSTLEEKKLEIKKEIDSNFKGFDETSGILWDSITSAAKIVRDGKDGGAIDEVKDRASVLERFINKKMWSIEELMRRKQKLDNTIKELRNLETLTAEQFAQYSSKLSNLHKIDNLSGFYFAFLKHYGKNISNLSNEIISEVEQIIKTSEKTEPPEILSSFIERRFIGKKYLPEELLETFLRCFKDVIIPLYIEDTIMKLFSIWPPAVISEKDSKLPQLEKEATYVGDYLIPHGKFIKIGSFPLPAEKEERSIENSITTQLVDNFSSVITALVYDIRGSTFMGSKLGNAERESIIRKNFGERMLKISEKYGAFPIKDTGDGGILLFAENSREIAAKMFASIKSGRDWARAKLPEENLQMKEGKECAKNAILAAKEMILEAQNFVSENINEYSDWFKKGEDREYFFKGMTYAQLPPSYKKLFQIGIGITSGHIGKDVYFSTNAYGDADITGNMVRDANLYSNARNPESSVILIDTVSLINVLLNEDIIEPVTHEKKIGTLSETEIYKYLHRKTEMLAKEQSKKVTYRLKKYELLIKRIGCRILEEGKEERIVPDVSISDLGLKITDEGRIMDRKGGSIKFLYEVTPEG
jgi:hypothetical protein